MSWNTLLNLEIATQQALAVEAQGESKITLFEDFEPNPGGQARFLELTNWTSTEPLKHRWSGLLGGIGGGKSYAGAIWACSRALLAPDARGMISANSYGQLARATLLALVEVCRTFNIPLEPWRESPEDQALAIANCQRCYIGPDRAFVYVLSATAFTGNTQAGRGLQIRWFWGDEFAYAAEKAFLTIDGRLGRGPGTLKGQGILTTSPAGYNYLWDKFGDPTRSDDLKRIYQMVSMPSLENKKHLGASVRG
jgi:hypothetical protein